MSDDNPIWGCCPIFKKVNVPPNPAHKYIVGINLSLRAEPSNSTSKRPSKDLIISWGRSWVIPDNEIRGE